MFVFGDHGGLEKGKGKREKCSLELSCQSSWAVEDSFLARGSFTFRRRKNNEQLRDLKASFVCVQPADINGVPSSSLPRCRLLTKSDFRP